MGVLGNHLGRIRVPRNVEVDAALEARGHDLVASEHDPGARNLLEQDAGDSTDQPAEIHGLVLAQDVEMRMGRFQENGLRALRFEPAPSPGRRAFVTGNGDVQSEVPRRSHDATLLEVR